MCQLTKASLNWNKIVDQINGGKYGKLIGTHCSGRSISRKALSNEVFAMVNADGRANDRFGRRNKKMQEDGASG